MAMENTLREGTQDSHNEWGRRSFEASTKYIE